MPKKFLGKLTVGFAEIFANRASAELYFRMLPLPGIILKTVILKTECKKALNISK